MSIFLLSHMPDCTPLCPCASCEAVAFLRSKLSEDDFATFLSKIRMAMAKRSGSYGKEAAAPPDASIDILELSVRAYNCLKNDNILTIGDLVKRTEAELLRSPNFGRRSLNEVIRELAKIGRRLGEVSE